MDDLKTIIQTFTAEDRKEFSLFVKRQKERKNRKDLELFRLLLSKNEVESDEIIKKLYPEDANAVAYYALRKRLMHQLSEFILLKQMKEDPTTASSVRGMLSLATYMLGVQQERIGWNMLRKAEKTAAANDQYDLLNSVFNLQIEWAGSEYADPLDDIISKRNSNKALADEEERANIAASLIASKLNEVRLQDREIPFDPIIQQVLQNYNLIEVAGKQPRLLYKLLSITRSMILVKRDFYSFEPYIIDKYTSMEQSNGFLPAHQYYKVNLLYMIAQTLYRNRKFEESLHYLDFLAKELNPEKKGIYQEFYPRYVLLSAANNSFLMRTTVAIRQLEDLLRKSSILNSKDLLNANLNLSFYYFQQGKYKLANQQLLSIQRSDKWCEKKMGKEWLLKKYLSELILQYEMGNVDLTLNKIRAIERGFSDLFKKSAYKNVAAYLQLIKKLLDQPEMVKSSAFIRKVERALEFAPAEQEDIHSISFYAWLKSKMVEKDYLKVLDELVKVR